jgi:hypothetical protein
VAEIGDKTMLSTAALAAIYSLVLALAVGLFVGVPIATVVNIKESGEFLFKLSLWVERDGVKTSLNGVDVDYKWTGPGLAYVSLGQLDSGNIVG